ncbi:MAG: 4-alpha-glucanotransferase [Verrucomicrobiales bacterium]
MSIRRGRLSGVLAPLFALRREADLGIGDVAALRELIDWAVEAGVGFIQLLPINETGPDHSPYNAISSVAMDPIYLDLSPGTVPELTAEDIEAALENQDVSALRGPWVDYTAVRQVKNHLLETAFARFWSRLRGGAGRADFERFRRDEALWLEDYAVFRWLMERANDSPAWDGWPAEFNTADAARRFRQAQTGVDRVAAERAITYRAWLQWLTFTQWRRLRAYARQRGVALMGDMPIGVSYYSADVFMRPELFQLDWSGGSPAETAYRDDPFVCKWGQNWGIPLFDWAAMERDGHAWWRQRVKKLVEVFEIFRVDHVLGFYRLYGFPWRPERNAEFLPLSPVEAVIRTGGRLPRFHPHDDDTPEHRALNREHGDRLLTMLQQAVEGAAIVGEDLGVVPDYVRPNLLDHAIPGFKIPQWEEGENGAGPRGADFPECSLATYATHDLPPLRTIWKTLRAESAGGGDSPSERGRIEFERLVCFAELEFGAAAPPYSDSLKWKLLSALFRSRSRLAAVQITDLFGLDDRFNTPGTSGGENWRVRLPWSVRQLQEDPILRREARRFHFLARQTNRA